MSHFHLPQSRQVLKLLGVSGSRPGKTMAYRYLMAGQGATYNKQHDSIAKIAATLILVIIAIMLMSCSMLSNGPDKTAHQLVDAFITADADQAKAITTPEQWERIDEWMKGREKIVCQRTGAMTGISSNGLLLKGEDDWGFTAGYQCDSQVTPYCLQINDILVKKTEDGWKVYDWGKVCEAPDYNYRCSELCSP